MSAGELEHCYVVDKSSANRVVVSFSLRDSAQGMGLKQILLHTDGSRTTRLSVKRETIADRLPYEYAVDCLRRILDIYEASDVNFARAGFTNDGHNFTAKEIGL